MPLTDDIATLNAVARQTLRQVFLEADLGISGVNFGVAEAGALCIITNEGNGRMVTTLPPVHIALMGIERLVPTWEDLALMLYLLPRSATGQKLTVYTNLIHSPRRPQDADGPQERHIILIDNGRSALRASPLAEALYCIRCGACLNACPVFREIGGHAYTDRQGVSSTYPGPIGAVISPALFGFEGYGRLARASSLCGACQEACPVDIDLPKLLLWAAADPSRFGLAQRLAGIASRLMPGDSGWLRLPTATGWGYRKDLPRPALTPFRIRIKQLNKTASGQAGREVDFATSLPGPNDKTTPWPSPETKPPSEPQKTLVARFQEELEALEGHFIPCREDELAGKLLELLKARDITTLQSWDTSQLPPRLAEALTSQGIQLVTEPNPEIRAGLTGACAAIAETGTLLLPSGNGQPLTASLLPEIHLAILHARHIHADLPQALKHPLLRAAATTVLISGPSRTADIEMTLTLGVHGPKEVFVFCLGVFPAAPAPGLTLNPGPDLVPAKFPGKQ